MCDTGVTEIVHSGEQNVIDIYIKNERMFHMLFFKDDEHEKAYNRILKCMAYVDEFHDSVAYLLALDSVIRKHVNDVFDFEDDCIKPDALSKPWQTGTSLRTTRLTFNLWCGWCGGEDENSSSDYSVAKIFDGTLADYYMVAVCIRFGI
jgi:hypothetical protein